MSNKSSGVGIWYGHRNSNRYVLEDLLKDDGYDFTELDPEDIAAVKAEQSPIGRLPTTLAKAREWWSPKREPNGNRT